MSQELHYTSVPRGLKPGSRGFCTVGQTPHMPVALTDRLEALSGYQPVFPPHDPSAPLNPIVFSHLRLTIGGKTMSVLSRIGPAGLDYTGRPNKYAHHVVLEGSERPDGGPAWLLNQPSFMQGAWDGEPREIPLGRAPLQGDRPPGMAHAWQALIGDGGWAGILAETFLADPRRTVFLVFRPGIDLLPLFVEALALLPASRRWEVDFSTYFSQLPQGVSCAWRGVLNGSADAKNAGRLPNALVLDFCQAFGHALGGELVHLARTGERIDNKPGATTTLPESGKHIPRMPRGQVVPIGDEADRSGVGRSRVTTGIYELLPELAKLSPVRGSKESPGDTGATRLSRWRPLALMGLITGMCVVSLIGVIILFQVEGVRQLLGFNLERDQLIIHGQEQVTKAKEERTVENARKADVPEVARPKPKEMIAKEISPITEPKSDPSPKPPKPAPAPGRQKLAAAPSKPQEPPFAFFPLPPIQESGLGKTEPELRPFQLRHRGDRLAAEKYYMGDLDVRRNVQNDRLEIWTNSSSKYGALRVATLKMEEGKLYFEWTADARQSKKVAESLRDGILKIATKDGDDYFVLLRGLKVKDAALSLSPVARPKIVKDDLKPRNLSLAWADSDSLVSTTWPLGIRKWKITSRIGAEPPMEIASAGESTPSAIIKQYIIPEEVWIRLEIDTKKDKVHILNVGLHFDNERVIRRRRETERLIYLANQQKTTHSERDELAMLRNKLGSKEDIRAIRDIERHLLPPSNLELSAVIGLSVDESTVLNLAKFGEFATPAD